MAKSISVRHKSAGRPVTTGTTPTVTIRLPEPIIAALDKIASERDISRTDVIRSILEQAISAKPGQKAKR